MNDGDCEWVSGWVGGLKNKTNMVFITKTMAQPQRKQAIFLNPVDLGVIELKALKQAEREREREKKSSVDWTEKKEKETMYE